MQEITTFISHHLALSLAAIIVFLLVIVVEMLRTKRNTFNIGIPKAVQMINHENAVVIDIRPEDAYRKGHIIDARNMPANTLRESPKKLEKFKNKPIILVCVAGIETQKLASSLIKSGYQAFSLAGGIKAWHEAQMPIVKE